LRSNDAKSFVCLSCGFIYYHSSAAVAVGIVEWDDKIILTKRAREPQKGLLALPGGFVDYEESLESALVRELQEELNLIVTAPIYLCSHWERYSFRDVVYFATIAFYVVSANDILNAKADDDIDAFVLVQPKDIDYGKLAFESDRVALDRYRRLKFKGEI
jgi:ADP-ribose pyrophosphatase YjhB (NUDIX family)